MKKGLLIAFVVSLVVLVFPLAVMAKGGPPPARSNTVTGRGNGASTQGGWLTGGVSLVEATAEASGMDVTDVIAALQGGASYADLASLDDIVAVMLDVRSEALAQAVLDERFTQEQVDAMLVQMEADLMSKLTSPWTAQGAANGNMMDGTQALDGSGYRGGSASQSRGGGRTFLPKLNQDFCPNITP